MTTMDTSPETEQVDVVAYDERRQKIADRMAQLPYGSQSRCAFDTRTAPTLVSSTLKGRYVSKAILDKIEGWLNEQGQATSSTESQEGA